MKKVNKISADTVWEIFWKSWELCRVNYRLSIAFVLSFGLLLLLGNTPYLGLIFSALFSPCFYLSILPTAKKWENKHPSSAQEALDEISNKAMIIKLSPLIYLSIFINLLSGIVFSISPTPFNIISWLLFLTLNTIMSFIWPIYYFNTQLNLRESFEWALEGTLKNIFPLFLGGVIYFILSILTALLFFLPFIFITAPLSLVYQYVWYRCVFEDLILEKSERSVDII